MAYTIVLDPRAIQDIQESIDYYEKQQPALVNDKKNILTNIFFY